MGIFEKGGINDMLKKKKSFYNGSKKGIRSNLFGLERAGGANNGESYCCNGKQTNPCLLYTSRCV